MDLATKKKLRGVALQVRRDARKTVISLEKLTQKTQKSIDRLNGMLPLLVTPDAQTSDGDPADSDYMKLFSAVGRTANQVQNVLVTLGYDLSQLKRTYDQSKGSQAQAERVLTELCEVLVLSDE